jgi:hypothetical protein
LDQLIFAAALYNRQNPQHHCSASGRNFHAVGKSKRRNKRKNKIMGDRSPKSNQKMSSQKNAKASSASHKHAQAVAAKQAAGKKK